MGDQDSLVLLVNPVKWKQLTPALPDLQALLDLLVNLVNLDNLAHHNLDNRDLKAHPAMLDLPVLPDMLVLLDNVVPMEMQAMEGNAPTALPLGRLQDIKVLQSIPCL